MRYYQKLVTTFTGKKAVLLLTAVFFSLTSMVPRRANFSGEWKLNESKSNHDGHFPSCIYDGGDRMRSKTMKIAGHVDFLTINVANSFRPLVSSTRGTLLTSHEKLTFDGKESVVTNVGRGGKKYTVSWSGDGLTMIINSLVFVTGYNAVVDRKHVKEEYKVIEVWKLINGGKSIFIQTYLKSNVIGVRFTKRVYDKVG